ncbi:MAG: PDZ domain-containing protein [Hungatella sp.]
MPAVNDPGKEPTKKRQFMREQIIKPPMTKRQIAKRILAFFFIAVLCGTAAGISFALAKPFAEKYLVKGTTEESSQISFSKDEPETSPVATEPPTTKAVETEPIEEILQSAIEQYQYEIGDLESLYSTVKTVGQEADKGIAVVHSVKKEMDWFNNPVETTGLYAGAIIASTPGELLILTPEAAIEHADSIKVAFSDGTEVSGTIKRADPISGMAIVSVDASQLEESARENIKALKLGNAYLVKQGDLVMALGGPSGMVHSLNYGFVSYVLRNVPVPDGLTRLLYADIKSNAGTGTFLINTAGEMIGWVTDQYKNENSEEMTVAMAISDYKSILEKMSNGIAIPYVGIKGQEVTSAMTEDGLPLGVYVVDSISDAPAYEAGIQNGDVITKVGEKSITTMKDYQNQIEALREGEIVTVTIQRKGIEEYKELEYQVTVGAR